MPQSPSSTSVAPPRTTKRRRLPLWHLETRPCSSYSAADQKTSAITCRRLRLLSSVGFHEFGFSEAGAFHDAHRFRTVSPDAHGSGQALGPSDKALSGSGRVSMKSPATPVATAARASTGTNSRYPPCPRGVDRMGGDSRPPGSRFLPHDRQAAHVRDQVVVTEPQHRAHRPGCNRRRLLRARRPWPWRRRFACRAGQETPLLDVHRLAAGGNRGDKIGLAAQEGALSMSTTSATGRIWSTSWTSVSTGMPSPA